MSTLPRVLSRKVETIFWTSASELNLALSVRPFHVARSFFDVASAILADVETWLPARRKARGYLETLSNI